MRIGDVGATGPIQTIYITPSSSSFSLKNITFITSARHIDLTNNKIYVIIKENAFCGEPLPWSPQFFLLLLTNKK